MFGAHVLAAAVADVPCRWCASNSFRPLGSDPLKISKPLEILLGGPCMKCRLDGTPPKPQAARTASGRTSTSNATAKASAWRQRARGLRFEGDEAGAAACEKNARAWETYARTGRGW